MERILAVHGRENSTRESVVQGMMVYIMMVYCWPKYLLYRLEMEKNNFIWTWDIHKRGTVTVKWFKLSKPIDEMGLGVRSLVTSTKLVWRS